MTDSVLPVVSVVVIGRNEGERLQRCLQSVSAMACTGFHFEIIYVDSNSTDRSVAIAEQHGAKTIVLNPARPTAALGRNAGWRAATGSFVLFLDGDTILHPEFVQYSLPEFAAPEIAIVWGHRREIHPERSLYNRVLDLDWIFPPGLTTYCGGDALFRRNVLEQAGGFDETLIAGEEPELCRRIASLGYQILHVDRPMTGHDLAITRWRQYWKRCVRAGHAFAEISERFRTSTYPFWRAEATANRKRVLALAAIPCAAVALSTLFHRPWPLLGALFVLSALALRSAWKARWKTNDVTALLLYGIHSHLQQFPVFAGQAQYYWNQRKGMRSMLLEYK